MPNPAIDLTGMVSGKLTVVSRAGSNKWGQAMWQCSCECGNEVTVLMNSLRHTTRKPTESCGCLIGSATVHGGAKTGALHSLYKTWSRMKERCHSETDHAYARYGGRGIVVYDEWKSSFSAFLAYVEAELGQKPTPEHTLDRIDNDRAYEPGNIRWATKVEQASNRRRRTNA